MKITVRRMPYEKVMQLPRPGHLRVMKPNPILTTLVRVLSEVNLRPVHFTHTAENMEKAGNGPWLILMNHSCFLDPQMVFSMLWPKPFQIVVTNDSMMGIPWVMQLLGCIPTQKYVTDLTLISDMLYAVRDLKTSVLMYPEAGYSFDGKTTTLPRRLGIVAKKLGVPLVYIQTYGAFARDPLYNGLRRRKVRVSAKMTCLVSAEELKTLSVQEIDDRIDEAFGFDSFAWQKENGIRITEPFRATGLERILYRCPACGREGHMKGEGTTLSCSACGKVYELTELGEMRALSGETEFPHIPDWFAWERAQVRREIEEGSYGLDTDVDIYAVVDYKAAYMVGQGHLTHNREGFRLTGCEGKLDYTQSPAAAHSLCCDFFWYEIGDVICVGTKDCQYYCIPKKQGQVTKTRFAVEELYKMTRPARKVRG